MRFQLYLAAMVANLTLVAAKVGLTSDTHGAVASASIILPRSPILRPISALFGSDNYGL